MKPLILSSSTALLEVALISSCSIHFKYHIKRPKLQISLICNSAYAYDKVGNISFLFSMLSKSFPKINNVQSSSWYSSMVYPVTS